MVWAWKWNPPRVAKFVVWARSTYLKETSRDDPGSNFDFGWGFSPAIGLSDSLRGYEAEHAVTWTLFPNLTSGFTCGSGRNISVNRSTYAGGISTDNQQDFDSRAVDMRQGDGSSRVSRVGISEICHVNSSPNSSNTRVVRFEAQHEM